MGVTERFTIFGGNGFVGSATAAVLSRDGAQVVRVGRGDWPEQGAHLGHVIFTIGMTADFRKRLVETVETQVLRLHEALTRYRFSSFMYLSSARVYAGVTSTKEETPLIVKPWEEDHVYNISKLAGESLCFAHADPAIRVVRLSNVFGATDVSNLFLTAVMREAVEKGSVTIGQSPVSSKDYIWVEDVARALGGIARHGRHRLYNVAAGSNLTHAGIAEVLGAAGYPVHFKEGGAVADFPPIDTSRLREEFDLQPTDARATIARVLNELKEKRKTA